jgi:hypothetical protein
MVPPQSISKASQDLHSCNGGQWLRQEYIYCSSYGLRCCWSWARLQVLCNYPAFKVIELTDEMSVDTAEVIPYNFVHGDYEITLIDTPGLNDTYRNESEVLMEIASWLEKTYRNPPHHKLTGIIYLQALTNRRIYDSTLRNLRMFRELCGYDALRNAVFATTG